MGARTSTWAALLLAGTALALACGSEPPPEPTGQWMGRAPAETDALGDAPRVAGVALRPSLPRPGEPVRAVARIEGERTPELRLSFHWAVNGRPVAAHGPELPGDLFRKGDLVEVTVSIDSPGHTGEPAVVAARAGNAAPRVLGVTLTPPTQPTPGTPLRLEVRAEDPDGDRLRTRVRWLVNGSEVARDTETLDTRRLRPGDRVVARVQVDDGGATSEPWETPPLVMANAPPVIRSQPAGLDAEGVFTYRIEAEDPEGESPLRYRLLAGPEGMRLDPVSGTVTWTPTADDAGEHRVEIAVEDARGAREVQRFALTVTAPSSAPAAAAE